MFDTGAIPHLKRNRGVVAGCRVVVPSRGSRLEQ